VIFITGKMALKQLIEGIHIMFMENYEKTIMILFKKHIFF
jgi:hypothetical protein